jgi:hypothetical protein
VPFGIGFEAQARRVDRAFLTDAGEHVLQGTPVGGVVEHPARGDEGNSHPRGEIGERGDAGAIVTAIRVPRREIKPGVKRCFDALQLVLEILRSIPLTRRPRRKVEVATLSPKGRGVRIRGAASIPPLPWGERASCRDARA